MNTTKEQQKELDDALVAPENCLKIGKSNLRLSLNLKSKEPTIQVVLDALKHTPFYNAFEIFADVPEIYIKKSGSLTPDITPSPSILEFEAFKTYRAYATGEKAPNSKATKKKVDSESSPKTKPSQASKGKRIKTSTKGNKSATTKSKGLTVLSKVALSEAEQMKLATKRSLKEFHISHASGSGDGVDILSNVPDEQQQTEFGTNEGVGEDEEEDEEHDSDDDNDDNDDEDDDQENDSQRTESDDEGDNFKVSTPPDYELTEEDENKQDDDTMGEEQGDDDNGELYRDLNINLSISDAEMTDAQTNPETEEAHQIPYTYLLSLLIIPQTPIPIIQPQQQTHDSTTTTTIPTTTMPEIPNFASLFGFERRVSSLESDLSELKQTNQFAEALSSIPGIVDKYPCVYGDRLRALLEAYNSDKDLLSSYGEVVILKLGKEESAKEATQKKSKSTGSSKGTTRSPPKSSDKSIQEEEHVPRVDDLEEPFHQEFDTGNDDVSPVREATNIDERL
ncbi:hypothetical protein Tco_1306929 [Tanacetum coccineum]